MKKIIIDKDFQGSIFFTSDTHFHHGNIIKYCSRPFKDPQEMDHALIQNWNSVVKDGDIVFHLGDFAFANKSKWGQLLSSLKGKIYLIQGNHDRNDEIPYELFEDVIDMMQVSIWDSELDSYCVCILGHYPLATWAGIYKSVINLHGHIHSTPDLKGTGFDMEVAQKAPWNQYDVGVDRNKFLPLSYDSLKIILTKRMLYEARAKQ